MRQLRRTTIKMLCEYWAMVVLPSGEFAAAEPLQECIPVSPEQIRLLALFSTDLPVDHVTER